MRKFGHTRAMTESEDKILAQQFRQLLRRYTGATPGAIIDVLCPILIPIESIDKTIVKLEGQSHYRATFTVALSELNRQIICRGRTGKFVPGVFADSGAWREIAKGRFIEFDETTGVALGEIYTGARKRELEVALEELTTEDLLEIDQYGAAAKVLSGLAEHSLQNQLMSQGYQVRRTPEDMARHLGAYANYDFEVSKGSEIRKVEVKSLWGTNTRFARLIHSTTSPPKGAASTWTDAQKKNYYPTSSCKFSTQDIFAVSLFLKTGNISNFAFARSVPNDVYAHGLPRTAAYPDHVNQNPTCEIGDGTWFASIDEVWDLP